MENPERHIGGVYLLYFTIPYKGCRHYIGWSENIHARYCTHIKGQGNPLVKAAIDNGAIVILSRVWPGKDRAFERKLKNRKKASLLCPHCNKNWATNGTK